MKLRDLVDGSGNARRRLELRQERNCATESSVVSSHGIMHAGASAGSWSVEIASTIEVLAPPGIRMSCVGYISASTFWN